uniref:Uncharacterized protein n=1 Tax=viral metagenome TaxID=1070528 RepID=A0A6H1Z967_9ZZZZ
MTTAPRKGTPVVVSWPDGRPDVRGYYQRAGAGGVHLVTAGKTGSAGWWASLEQLEEVKP